MMKHTLKRVLSLGTALVLTLGLSTAALAAEAAPTETTAPAETTASAETTGIAVQLNGENLTFTDAAPQVKDNRTFLPFRAVFEAMDAEVSNEGDVITAVRDGKTLTMTIGSTEATLTEGETATALNMDVAPYVDNATWRTYVPVRFAAQAFGCAVGWDQDDQTAVIVDADELLSAAVEGKKYTVLAKYMDYGKQFNEGAWDMTADFNADVSMLGMGPMTVDGTLKGIMADAVKAQMTMNMKIDLEEFMADLSALAAAGTDAAPTELSAEDKAALAILKTEGIGLEMRMDMDKGMMYMTFSGAALKSLGLPADTWYSMDMGAIFDQMGMDYSELMDMSKSMDAAVLLDTMLQGADLSDKDAAYATVSDLVATAADLFSDEGFKKDGNNYTTSYTYAENGADMTISFTLNTKNDKVVGYSMDMKMTMLDETTGKSTEVMTMTMAMDEKNHMTADMKMDMMNMMTMNMTMTGDYKATTSAPVVEPPAGATVLPFEEMEMEAGSAEAETTPAA